MRWPGEQRLTALISLFLCSHHQEIVHAVDEVVHDDPVEAVRVSLKSPVNRVTASLTPVRARSIALRLIFCVCLELF